MVTFEVNQTEFLINMFRPLLLKAPARKLPALLMS